MEFSLSEFAPIADRVWRAVAQPENVTIGVIAGDAGALVFDTGSTPAQGRAIREAAERVAGVPVVAAVASHHHVDHLFGLQAFADVATYGHTSVAASLDSNEALPDELARLGLTRDDLALPNRSFNLARTVDLGGRHVELVHFGPGHTPGDVLAIVPDARVVFAGDLVEEAGPPQVSAESSLAGWPKALDGLLAMFRHPWLIVPGHGEPVDREFVMIQRGTLAGIYLQLEYLFAQGALPDEALARGEWDYPIESFSDAVPGLYADLKARGKIGRPQLPVIH